MKKLLLTTIVLIGIIVLAEAQITGGGEQEAPPPPPPTTVPVVQAKETPGYKMIQFAYVAPNSSFNVDAGGAGGSMGISAFSPFYTFMEGFEAGLLYGGDLQINSFDDENVETVYAPFVFVDFLLGPSVDYQFAEGIGISSGFRLGPVLAFGPDVDIPTGIDPLLGFTTTANIYNTGAAFGLGTAFNINLNINKLVIGLEFTGGRLTYEFENSSDNSTFEEEISIGCTRISLGSRF